MIPAITNGIPARFATSIAVAVPLSGWIRPKKTKESPPGPTCERPDINAVVNRGRVGKCRMAVGVADRHVLDAIGVFEICGQGGVGGKSVDGGDHRRVDQSGVGEREEIETVVDQIEIGGAFEHRGDVQRLPRLGVECRVFGVPGGCNAHQPGRR